MACVPRAGGLLRLKSHVSMETDCKPHHIHFSDISFYLIILFIQFRWEWNISLTILKFNSLYSEKLQSPLTKDTDGGKDFIKIFVFFQTY